MPLLYGADKDDDLMPTDLDADFDLDIDAGHSVVPPGEIWDAPTLVSTKEEALLQEDVSGDYPTEGPSIDLSSMTQNPELPSVADAEEDFPLLPSFASDTIPATIEIDSEEPKNKLPQIGGTPNSWQTDLMKTEKVPLSIMQEDDGDKIDTVPRIEVPVVSPELSMAPTEENKIDFFK